MRGAIVNAAMTAVAVGVLYSVVWLYGAALRDPRFLDGWILFAGILVQLSFHFRKQRPAILAGRVAGWLKVHIYCGYLVIAIFLLHTDFSWPDSLFEGVLWAIFVLVAVSGAVGAYLTRAIPTKLTPDEAQTDFQQMKALRFDLERKVCDLALGSVEPGGSPVLSEFYVSRLHDFFKRPRNLLAHLRGSRRPLARLHSEIDTLERYVDVQGRQDLHTIKGLVTAKNRLDFQYAHHGLLQTWLFLHIPATYCLIVLSILHVAVVYAYSSGVP